MLARSEGVELRAVAEPDAEARAAVRKVAPRATVFDDWRGALALSDVNGVVIALPTDLHAEAACAAFGAGKHVYLEKPIATSLAEAERVVGAWRASRRVGMAGFNGRFDPTVTRLKRALVGGRVGRVIGGRFAIGGASEEPPLWKRSRATGGGAILDLGSHAVDLTRYLFEKEIEAVVAGVSASRTEDDTASLVFTLIGGTIVQAFVSLAGVQESVLEIVGERGVLVADRYAGTLTLRPPRPPYGRLAHLRREVMRAPAIAKAAWKIARPPDDAASFRASLAAFVRAVSGGPLAGASIDDGYRNLAVLVAAEAAARAGEPVATPIGMA